MALANEIKFFAATDVGRKRAHNEDNFLIDHDLGLYVVADGMGGHAAGEVASAIAVRAIHEVLSGERDMLADRATNGPQSEVTVRQLLATLDYAVQVASQRINAEAVKDPRKRGMGTTVSVLLIVDRNGYVAHVGDSRIYLVREGVVHQVTEDHTVANELVRLGMVTPDQLDRVPRKNAITRAVGVYQHAEVDTVTLEILPNDQFLLCSDGLCGYYDDLGRNLAADLKESDGEKVIQSLIHFANEAGGKDNITAVLVRLGGGDASDSQRARRLLLKRELLASLPLFSHLNERELLRLMQVAEVYQYEANEHVVKEGEQGDQMFVTLQGKLKVMVGKAVLDEYGPGDQFGEMALIRSTARSASVKAIVPSEVVSIKRSDFFDILRTEPHLAVKLLWQFLGVLANRLEHTTRDLMLAKESLGEKSSPAPRWVDEEPSLDPFTAVSQHHDIRELQRALQALPAHGTMDDVLWDEARKQVEAAAAAEREVERVDKLSFDDAPAMAERIADPPSFDSGSGSDYDAEAAARIRAVAARFAQDPDAPFDAKSTRPRGPGTAPSQPDPPQKKRPEKKLPLDEQKTLPMINADSVRQTIDAKRTLPSSGIAHRLRQQTLKSAAPNLDRVVSSSAPPPATPPATPPVTPQPGSALPSTKPEDHNKEAPASPRDRAPQGENRAPQGENRVSSDARVTVADPGKQRVNRDASTLTDGKLREARRAMSEAETRDLLAMGRGTLPEQLEAADGEPTALDKADTHDSQAKRDRDRFRPTKVTIPLDPPDTLKSELDALRKEFKERLKQSRKAREQKDGD